MGAEPGPVLPSEECAKASACAAGSGLQPGGVGEGESAHKRGLCFGRRDFANGFLFAEIMSRYYPADVQMHSFENVASMTRKKQNWALLEKVFKVGPGNGLNAGIAAQAAATAA